MKFVNMSGKFNNTIHRMDFGIYEEINEVVQAEPSEGQSPELLGMLASILSIVALYILIMVVLVGNGHIIQKFGIPNRAFARNPAAFKTIYLAPVGGEAELSWADYLWVTPDQRPPRHPMRARAMKKQ